MLKAASRHIPWNWIGLAVIIAGLVIAGRLLPVSQWLNQIDGWIAGRGIPGILIFAAAYAAAAVFFVPGSVLTLGAGFIFGLFWGTVAVSFGSTLGAGLAFLVSRYIARDRVLKMAAGSERFAAIDEAIGKQGWKIVLLLRLSPLIPFNLSNYLYGLTGIAFWPYVFASWIGMLPATVLYVYLGTAGRKGLQTAAGQAAQHSVVQTVFWGAGLVATIIVTWFISRIAKRALQRTGTGTGEKTNNV